LTKVPSLNYPEVIRAFQRAGWTLVRQKGSHIKLQREVEGSTLTIIVPAHKPIKRSTLATILKQADLSIEQFLALLR
jgi:predicted RNA binding protein YcfA (HicA-like mRNA interferase family)